MEESTGKKVNIERSQEAIDTGADEVAVACPFCYIMMDDGVKELGYGDNVKVRDVSLILLDNLKRLGVISHKKFLNISIRLINTVNNI